VVVDEVVLVGGSVVVVVVVVVAGAVVVVVVVVVVDANVVDVEDVVVDSTRPSASNYNDFAELVKTEGSVSLWKIKNPYQGEILKPSNPCGPDSLPSES
jgi:hypothetical protein